MIAGFARTSAHANIIEALDTLKHAWKYSINTYERAVLGSKEEVKE